MSDRHREGMKATMKHFRLGRSPSEKDVENAIRAYHEKAYKRQDNASGGAAKATVERYVGPWEPIDE